MPVEQSLIYDSSTKPWVLALYSDEGRLERLRAHGVYDANQPTTPSTLLALGYLQADIDCYYEGVYSARGCDADGVVNDFDPTDVDELIANDMIDDDMVDMVDGEPDEGFDDEDCY